MAIYVPRSVQQAIPQPFITGNVNPDAFGAAGARASGNMVTASNNNAGLAQQMINRRNGAKREEADLAYFAALTDYKNNMAAGDAWDEESAQAAKTFAEQTRAKMLDEHGKGMFSTPGSKAMLDRQLQRREADFLDVDRDWETLNV